MNRSSRPKADETPVLGDALKEYELFGYSVAATSYLDDNHFPKYVVGAQGARERAGDVWLLYGFPDREGR